MNYVFCNHLLSVVLGILNLLYFSSSAHSLKFIIFHLLVQEARKRMIHLGRGIIFQSEFKRSFFIFSETINYNLSYSFGFFVTVLSVFMSYLVPLWFLIFFFSYMMRIWLS